MADLKVVRVYDSIYGDGAHKFSVVATDSSVEYIFPKDLDLFDGKSRIQNLLKRFEKPTDVDGWLSLGLKNFESFSAKNVIIPAEVKNVKKAIAAEKAVIDDKDINFRVPLLTPSEQRITQASNDLLAIDPDFEEFAEGISEELSEESMKAHIAGMIDAAGTRDLNPWLEPWLNGELEDLDFSQGLVLSRPAPRQESLFAEEGNL